MQEPTCQNLHVRSPHDARIIFHAVKLKILPMITRRLDTEERQMIKSGQVYVWEERGQNADLTGVGIERWTDGIRWGPSRVRDGFLFYQEKRERSQFSTNDFGFDNMSLPRSETSVLHKQTYTVFVDTSKGQRKWHLIAYFTQESLARLQVVDDSPVLMRLSVPHGSYQSARHPKGRPEHIFNPQLEGSTEFVPYIPSGASSPPPGPSAYASSSTYASPSTYTSPSSPSSFIMWPNTRHPSHQRHSSMSRSPSSSDSHSNETGDLAPLEYLQAIPLKRRHPEDEKTLMLLRPTPL